jgi:putative transcriptional regulator
MMQHPNFSVLGEDLLEGLQHAIAHADGKAGDTVEHTIRIPDVSAIRHRLNVSQEVFAERFHLPLGTLRNWEQKRREPDVAACLLLYLIEKAPETISQLLQDKR